MIVNLRPVRFPNASTAEICTLDDADAVGIYREDKDGREVHIVDITRDDPNWRALAECLECFGESEVS